MDDLDRKRWEAVEEIFAVAVELPDGEREAYARAASGGDPEILSRVQSLLRADGPAGDFLETPAFSANSLNTNPLALAALRALAASESPGDSDSGDLDELPSFAPPPLAPGDMLCARFRILRLLGEGGMGYVYEARDQELNRSVALKVIRPEIAGHPDALHRFRREVALALKITHPNVCRTFDLERDPSPEFAANSPSAQNGAPREVLFLTMEFLPGETLAARLRRAGPMPLDEALAIAAQVAAALDCAHQAGILHRDIKPANIMLVPAQANSGPNTAANGARPAIRAVVTDFGLARQETLFPTADRTAVTRSGAAFGSFAYMAPEQLEGAPTTPATDVYALGLLLFEMATGQRAFPSENPLASLKQRLTGPPPSPQSLLPGLPERWLLAIEGCLRVDPAARLQTPSEALAVLTGARSQIPAPALKPATQSPEPAAPSRKFASHRPTFRHPFPTNWPRNRKILAVSLALLAGVSLSVGGLRLYQSREDATVQPGALLYLTPVKNQTGERALDNLTELLRASLAQSAQINLLDQGTVGDILQRMTKSPDTPITEPIAREIALRTGAVRVVFPTLTSHNTTYTLHIDMQQPDPDAATGPSHFRGDWQQSFTWQSPATTGAASLTIPPQLTFALRNAADWIRQQAGESKKDIFRLDTSPEDVTTGSWQALTEYNNALAFSAHGKPGSAVLALQRAVLIDPQFALAYGLLGDTLAALHRTPEAYEAYRNALSIDREPRLTPRERDRIKGMYALDSGDMEAAVTAFRDYTTYYENDPTGWAYSSYPLEMLGRTPEAITALKRAATLDPHRSFPMNELITCYLSLGQYDNAREWIGRLRSEGYPGWALVEEGELHFLEGEYDQAAASFHSAGDADASYRESGNSLLARLEAERGNYPAAIESLNQDIDLERAKGDNGDLAASLLDRAYLEGNHGEIDASLKDADQAIELNPSVQDILKASNALGEANFATHGARAADISKALEKLASQLPSSETSTIFEIARLRVHGELMLTQNRWQQAVSAFSDAAQLDAPASTREYLARALAIAADRQPKPGMRQELQVKANKAYETVSLREGFIWSRPTDFPPGFYADHVAESLKLNLLAKSFSGAEEQTLEWYKQLRPEESTTLLSLRLQVGETLQARRNNSLKKEN